MENDIEKKQYEVGDVVIGKRTYHGYSKHIVVRTTKTQAILNSGARLRIDNVKSSRAIGESGYVATYYQITNKDLESNYKKEIQIRGIKRHFAKLNLSEMNEEDLESFYDTIYLLSKKYLITQPQ